MLSYVGLRSRNRISMEGIKELFLVIWNIILTIRIWDIIDIAIVAYLIYHLLVFVRKTSSGNVFKGIVLLIVIMWVSSMLHLNMISYLLGKTMELGILALIILFQPEIRKFLGQVGTSNIRSFFGKNKDIQLIETAIEHTVAACRDMSASKTGALIVFERDILLDDYVKTGTIVNSEPSAELLKNIFFPKTPLHDGAVIIKDGRIISAGCMLPMTSNTNLSRDLGMRHRAAIGMSERSDAVVVIVSEETGSISVAIDGMLKRHLTIPTLEKLLMQELITETDKKKQDRFSLKKLFR